MKKIMLIGAIMLLIINITKANQIRATITTKDGKSYIGDINFPLAPGFKTIIMQTDKGKEKFKLNEVALVQVYDENGNSSDYSVIQIPTLKKPETILAQNLISEGEVRLYSKKGVVKTDKGEQTLEYFYVMRDKEDVASLILITGDETGLDVDRLFAKACMKYFSDDPSIVSKVAKGEYGYKDILKIVNEYNHYKSDN